MALNAIRLHCGSINRIDQVKKILYVYAIMKGVTPSDHQITLMAYLIIYGINKTTRSMVVDSMKMYLNYETYGRAINKLNEYGFLVKGEDRAQYYIAPEIKIPDQEDIGIILYIKKPVINNNGTPL